MEDGLKKVQIIKDFEYLGSPVRSGYVIWVRDIDLDGLIQEQKVRVLPIPENRIHK